MPRIRVDRAYGEGKSLHSVNHYSVTWGIGRNMFSIKSFYNTMNTSIDEHS